MGFVLESPLPRTRLTWLVPVVVLLLLVVGGVVVHRATRPSYDPDTAARTAAGVTVLLYTEQWDGAISAVSGVTRLEVLEGGCLGLADGSLLVFPHGSTVLSRDGQVAVEVPRQSAEGTKVVRPGDVVDIGGSTPGPVEDVGGHLAEHVPADCRAREATSGIELNVDTPTLR